MGWALGFCAEEGAGLLAGPGGSCTRLLVPGKQAQGAGSWQPPGACILSWEQALLKRAPLAQGSLSAILQFR